MKLLPKKTDNQCQSGFTLVELIASIFIFSIVIIVFGNVFISSLNMQRRAFNIQQIVENANFVFDSIVKEIRVAQITTPDVNCLTDPPATQIEFTDPVGVKVVYKLLNGAVHRIIEAVPGEPIDTVLSSSKVEFTRFQFCISGSANGDSTQPRVTVIANVKSKGAQQQESIDLQATLSQRYLSN